MARKPETILECNDTKDLDKFLRGQGYTARDCGGHTVYSKPNTAPLSVPRHNGYLSKGVLRNLAKLFLGNAYYEKPHNLG